MRSGECPLWVESGHYTWFNGRVGTPVNVGYPAGVQGQEGESMRRTTGTRWARLLAVTIGVALCAQAQEYRDTAVPNSQIANVLRDVAQWHDFQYPDCRYTGPVGSVRAEAENGNEERWTIAGCDGRQFTYRVSVVSQNQGAVTVLVGNVGGAPVKQKSKLGQDQREQSCEDIAKELASLGDDIDKVPDDKVSRMAQLTADNAACQGAAKAEGDR